MDTKWSHNWSSGLTLGACCTIFRARPAGAGLGAKFGRKVTETKTKLQLSFLLLGLIATYLAVLKMIFIFVLGPGGPGGGSGLSLS